ncbi:Cue3 protein [Maudiozyma humilis]|uniref:Cue3 protein n=1 Tax=Maudiozyma humilis TaxID=51915 RepID=A0AAV5RUZ4_MAUHU|nr:hypothetical protein DAKH74_011050 [Kazachstania humilis]GMM55142.1 Cue3 protein [Kazachstania humilis]
MPPKIVEIEGKIEQLNFPIVTFPPFKLRAQLIEKDPVVWVHLLDTYIQFFEYINSEGNISKLDDSTLDHLCIFIRSYINEMANEEGKLLSLGVNHYVQENLNILRAWVLYTLKSCGLFYLQVFGETLWNFVILYVEKNPRTVRALIEGSLKPKVANIPRVQVNRIGQIHQHIKSLVENNKFTRTDLKSFQFLVDDKEFADKYFTINWVECLEGWWDKGNGRFSNTAKQLMITSILRVRRKVIVDTTKSLGVSSLDTLSIYPLLGAILINQRFNELRPDVKQEMTFLNFAAGGTTAIPSSNIDESSQPEDTPVSDTPAVSISDDDIDALRNFFPDLSKHQITELLKMYDSNVELITNLLFEDPSIVDNIPRDEPEHVETTPAVENIAELDDQLDELQLHEDTIKSTVSPMSDITKKQVPDEVRNRTLTRALELLYDKDDDERDDTYDEAEIDRSKTSGKVAIDDDSNDNAEIEEKKEESRYDKIEGYLWNLLKEDATLFERAKRGSKIRKTMKQDTTWSDEQIEGWARMLQKSPQRARILEEKFMFRGNKKRGKTSYVKNRDGDNATDNKRKNERYVRTPRKPTEKSNANENDPAKAKTNEKRKNARNEKNKASRANHNRKAGHDKKSARAMP